MAVSSVQLTVAAMASLVLVLWVPTPTRANPVDMGKPALQLKLLLPPHLLQLVDLAAVAL